MKKNAEIKFLGALAAIVLFGISTIFGIDFTFDQHPLDSPQEVAKSELSVDTEINRGQSYTHPEEVAAYLNEFQELPPNYITKNEAEELGWNNKEGNLQEVAPGMSIGGDHFGNFEGLLPEVEGRDYYEADVNYDGGYRGSERLVFSNDGLIFYTDDHYDSFTQLE